MHIIFPSMYIYICMYVPVRVCMPGYVHKRHLELHAVCSVCLSVVCVYVCVCLYILLTLCVHVHITWVYLVLDTSAEGNLATQGFPKASERESERPLHAQQQMRCCPSRRGPEVGTGGTQNRPNMR